MRLQRRVADLDQLRFVVLGKDADINFVWTIDAPIEEQRQLVGFVELVRRPHIRKWLEISIAIALVRVVIGIHVVVHLHRLQADAALKLHALTFKHIVAVERRNRFAIRCPPTRACINGRVLPGEELHVHRNGAVAPLEARLDAALPQRLDVIRVQVHHMLVREQLERIASHKRRQCVRKKVFLVFAVKRVVPGERECVSRLRELVGQDCAAEGRVLDLVLQKLPETVAVLQRAVEKRIVTVVEDLLPVEQAGQREGVLVIKGVVDAPVQRGVIGAPVALHLLDDDRAIVVRAGGELVLVERRRIEPVRLQKAVGGSLPIIERD